MVGRASHEPPPRSGVSAERRNSWEQQPAALCRDAATPGFMASIHVRILEVFPTHEHRGTFNIERPTSNIEWQSESSLTSAFDVRCWTFDVFPRFRGFNARIFISRKSLPEGEGQGEEERVDDLREAAAVSRNGRTSRVLRQSRRFPDMIMTSPVAALAWEIWRKNRFGFLLLFVFLIVCLALGRTAAHFAAEA